MIKPIVTLVFAATWLFFNSVVSAGGGPENLILVVNANSDSSKLIANYYAQLRKIPASNVIYLDEIPNTEQIPLSVFKQSILLPVIAQINERNLSSQIDYIVYSSDFPTQIDLAPSLKSLQPPLGNNRLMLPMASLNAMTYFCRQVLSDSSAFISLTENLYMRQRNTLLLIRPFVGEAQNKFNSALRAMRDGNFEESAATFRELYREHPTQIAISYWLARVYASQGDAEEACQWLKRSVAAGWSYRDYTKSDSSFEKILDNAQFREIVNSMPDEDFRYLPTRGFRSTYHWGGNGMVNGNDEQGQTYVLSTVLAVTRNQGNTEQMALDQILRSVNADGSQPQGKFYFTLTKDVRTKTRAVNFDSAITELRALGYESEIVDGIMPLKKTDIVGLCMGKGKFNFASSKSKIVAGAICENLTSFGGRLDQPGQTPLTEFLQFGAAGSSGTVIEPYAIQEKFPHPRIHTHYVKGCSLAESFYQSVHGPFQLLIVGDALCQPWATFPQIKANGLEPMQKVSGIQEIELELGSVPAIGSLEFYIDGRLVQQLQPRDTLRFDSTAMSDGFHELRIVGISADAIESQGRAIIPIMVDNKGEMASLRTDQKRVDEKDYVEFVVTSNCGSTIHLVQNFKVIATASGQNATFKIKAKTLGRGPVSLTATAATEDEVVSSAPLEIQVDGEISTVRSVTTPQIPSKPKSKKNNPPAKQESSTGKK